MLNGIGERPGNCLAFIISRSGSLCFSEDGPGNDLCIRIRGNMNSAAGDRRYLNLLAQSNSGIGQIIHLPERIDGSTEPLGYSAQSVAGHHPVMPTLYAVALCSNSLNLFAAYY